MIFLAILPLLAAVLYILAPLFTESPNLSLDFAANRENLFRLTRSNSFANGVQIHDANHHNPNREIVDQEMKQYFLPLLKIEQNILSKLHQPEKNKG